MLRPKSPQSSFYGSYLYDRIVPQDHLLRKINQVVDFSFVNEPNSIIQKLKVLLEINIPLKIFENFCPRLGYSP